MTRKWILPLAALALVSGSAIYFFIQNSPSLYERYVGHRTIPGVQFEYPRGWKIREDNGRIERYSQVLALGPRQSAKTMRSAFIVRQIPTGGRFESLAGLKQNRLAHLYKNPHVVSEDPVRLDKGPAEAVIATYTALPPVDGPGPFTPMDVKTKMIFAEKNKAFYEIIFMADRREFDKYADDFEHLVSSFRFSS